MNVKVRLLIILSLVLVAALVLLFAFRKPPTTHSPAISTQPTAITFTGGNRRDFLLESLTRLVRKEGALLGEAEMVTPVLDLNPDLSILDLQEWLLSAEHEMGVVVYEKDLLAAAKGKEGRNWHRFITPAELVEVLLPEGGSGSGEASGNPSQNPVKEAQKK